MFENMTTEIIIGLGGLVLGLILLFGAVFRKQAGLKNLNPMWAGVIGTLLIVFGGIVGLLPMIPEEGGTVVNVDAPGVTLTQPTFSLDVTNGTTGLGNTTTVQVNEDETMATVLLETCGSGGNQPLAGTHFGVNFTVAPIPPNGATADSLATVYFETDYLMKFNGEYILAESDGTYYANWSYAGGTSDEALKDYASQMTMLMTEVGYAEITYEMDSGSADRFSAELDTIGDTGSWDIVFHNEDWSWSETFTVTWILVEQ